MTPPPSISVLLPVRNAAPTLARAVESILAQTLADWECLIVNDGSSDATAEIAEDFAHRDPRIRVFHQLPEGLVVALQHGLTKSRGAFIARMDADDFSHPERLATQERALVSNPSLGLVSCLVAHGGDAGCQQGYAAHIEWLNRVRSPEEISLARFIDAPVAHPSVMFRREVMEIHGSYRDGPFPEDYELWLRWLDQGVTLAKVPETLLVWNDPPQRLSRTCSRYAVEAFYEIKCHYLDAWLGKNLAWSREIYLWGAGRITRQRFRALEQTYRPFAGFVDVDAAKVGNTLGGRSVIFPEAIPGKAFVLVGVAARGAREEICQFLETTGRIQGLDFLLAA